MLPSSRTPVSLLLALSLALPVGRGPAPRHSAAAHLPRGAPTKTVSVGISPIALATSGATGHVFVLNAGPRRGAYRAFVGPGSVTMLDAATGAVLRTTPIGIFPLGLAVDDRAGRVVVVTEGAVNVDNETVGSGAVYLLDTASGRLRRTIAVGRNPGSPIVDYSSGRVYLTDTARLRALDPATGRLIASIPLSLASILALDEPTHHLFLDTGPACALRNDFNCGVTLVDTRTFRPVRTRVLPYASQGSAVDDAPTGRVVLSVGFVRMGGYVALLDAHTGALAHTVPLPSGQYSAIAADPRGGRAFVVSQGTTYNPAVTKVALLDTRSGRLTPLATQPLASMSASASAPLVDVARDRLLVATVESDRLGQPHPGVIYVLNGRTGAIIAHAAVGRSLSIPAMTVAAPKGLVFVTNDVDNTVSILDPSTW